MNKLLIVGHTTTPSGDIEALLNQCGMAKPLPSRKDEFSPQQIGQTILKASVSNLHSSESQDLVQVAPGPLWQSLMLDMMLGNLNQDFWGWSDPDAVYLLDYWKSVDPTLKFVLVYSDPSAAIEQAESQGESAEGHVAESLGQWVRYNSALLKFHNFNRDRSVLVHSEEALSSAHSYVQQLRLRLDAPLSEPPARFSTSLVSDPGLQEGSGSISSHSVAPVDRIGELEPKSPNDTASIRMLSRHLAGRLVDLSSEAQSLYEELQASANLPSQRIDSTENAEVAWRAFRTLVNNSLQLKDDLRKALSANEDQAAIAVEKLKDFDKALQGSRLALDSMAEREAAALAAQESTLLENAALRARISASEAQAVSVSSLSAERENLASQNEMLLDQLHNVQEELEVQHLNLARLKKELDSFKNPQYFGAAARIKEKLEYRLGALMLQRSKSVAGWFGMYGALRSVIKQDRNSPKNTSLPPISSYRDAHEAERVKCHLSYRLGEAYVENSRSIVGFMRLPFAVRRAVSEFERDRASKK